MLCRSYAKLNLYLAVLDKRPDHYHNLITLFERIGLYDSITLTARADGRIRIRCSCPGVPRDATNLCYRSAALLQEVSGCGMGVDILLKKRIPPGAGLGGGSSNAASVLAGLNRLWGLGYGLKKLSVLGAQIGADVPFFLYDTSFALASGRGDRIAPLQAQLKKPLWHVVIVPQHIVPTPVIYKKWDELSGKRAGSSSAMKMLTKHRKNVKLLLQYIKYLKNSEDFRCFGDFLFNDLEPVTESLYPEVRRVKAALKTLGVHAVMMSGSGPAVFGIVRSRKEAALLVKTLKRRNTSWKICAVPTV